ncbi:MAG: hypothetical protein PCFJNLEI_02116 [Verrucomicrobiae bacterium]|nr:hypothetical protein [Verrucomicrobiae bacterium]
MIDGTKTTFDWQASATDIAVLPVGSFEQHSSHLPLLTDDILAEHFGRMAAEELDAALLPVMNFGTCFEHSAFRGSVTLRPETQMAIVRDVAAAVERHGFRFLVIVNSHGGNFSLLPPAREINTQNRPLKVVLVNWWEYCDPDCVSDKIPIAGEVHAGAWETSIMLALRPELVGNDRRDRVVDPTDPLPLVQRDLTMFGSGHLAPGGAIGHPSKAKVEIGQAALRSIRQNLGRYLRDRIARLRKNPIY